MNCLPLLSSPAAFVTRFIAVVFPLLLVWGSVSKYYLATLISLVNFGSRLVGMPPQLQLPPFAGQDIVFTGVVGGIALFAVTPDRPFVWKLRWIARLLALLWMAHLVVLFLQVHVVYSQITEHLHRQQNPHSLSMMPAVYRTCTGHLIEFWRYWGSAVLSLLVWFAALPRHADTPLKDAEQRPQR